MRNKKNKRFGKSFLAFTLALSLLLTSVGGTVEVFAEENLKPMDSTNGRVVEKPEPKASITEDAKGEAAELQLGNEIVGAPVGAAVKKPTIDLVSPGATKITGKGLVGSGQRKRIGEDCKIHVTVKTKSGDTVETKTFIIGPTERPKTGEPEWSVTLDNPVQEGYKVIVQQEFNGNSSEEVSLEVKKLLADLYKDKLEMPEGEIWIEQYVSNIVSEDEKAEAVDLLKKANPTIANDIQSVEFKITGVDPKTASYTVTYTDKSKTGEIQAPKLTVKKVTEYSQSPTIAKTYVADGQITITFENEIAKGSKIGIIQTIDANEKDKFCSDEGTCSTGKCTITKSTITWVSVDASTKTFTHKIDDNFLECGKDFGVIVKEPKKFPSCKKTNPEIKIPNLVGVRDPKNLTEEEKKAIDAAIRKANTTKDGTGVSKLPDWTANNVPAIIDFDKDGNVKIINPSEVDGDWNEDYTKFVPKRNPDGSVKLNDGAKPAATIQAKDLLKNIKPDVPTLALSDDKKNITITPNKLDTDAHIITVSYKDKKGKDQTTTATKADDGTWSITSGAGSVGTDGVVTIPTNLIKGGTDVKANVTDNGEYDKSNPLQSDEATLTLEKNKTKADQITELGGLDPVVMKKWVKDKLDWKDGVKAKDDAKKDEVNNLLAGATFEDFQDDASKAKRNTDEANNITGFVGKIKVKFDDDSELVVDNQTLYVSNHVTWFAREEKPGGKIVLNKNTPDDALVVVFKLGEGTKVDNTTSGAIEGNKDNPVNYQTYKVKPNTDLKDYKLPVVNTSVVDSINLTAQDGYTEAKWNTEDFTATDNNKVFTATATKTFKVTVKPNGGNGDEKVEIKKKDETFKLPAANTFTPPNENQEFSGWKIGDDTNLKQPETEITITGDTEINAIWKPIEFKVNFKAGEGASGSMEDKTVTKGSEYELPTPTFTAPKDKVFAGWKVGDQEGVKQAKEKIQISGNVTLTATWKDIMVNVSYNANGGSGKMEGKELKKGSTLTLPSNSFTAPKNQEFAGWQVGKETKKVGDEITVNENTVIKPIWKPIEFKVNFKAGEGASGSMEDKTVTKGSEYELPTPTFTAPKDKVFAGWKVGDQEGVKQAKEKIQISGNVTLTATWKPIMVDVSFDNGEGSGNKDKVSVAKGSDYILPNSDGFTAPAGKEFAGWKVGNEDGVKQAGETIQITDNETLTATWKDIMVNVSYNANGGSGKMEGKELKKGSTLTLPSNSFTAPAGKEFAGWLVGDATTTTEAGTEITITGDTIIKATWKPIMVDVSFDNGEGSGNKDKVSVAKGSDYILPNSDGFTAPAGKEFAGWKVGNETKKVGDKITVNENTVVKALWKAKAKPGKKTGSKGKGPIFPDLDKPMLNSEDHSQYMIGYKDGTFRPNNNMSRQEVTVMLSRLLRERPQKGIIYSRDYKDVADNLWSVTAISYMSNLKIVRGYPDGNFKPYANITRAEFAAMAVRFDNISAAGSKTFTDLQKDHWAYDVIQKAAQAGWLSGYPDGSFKPDQPITRGEVVSITNRMLNRFADEEFVDHNLNKITNFTDIDKSHWAYYPIVEATNGHKYKRKGNGKDETWSEVTGSTFVYDK